MNTHPTKLSMADDGRLEIEWSDGQVRLYAVRELRDRCPCATCREERTAPPKDEPGQLPIIDPSEAGPLRIVQMDPVGNYAYSIHFSDGHQSGIYPLELLRELGDEL